MLLAGHPADGDGGSHAALFVSFNVKAAARPVKDSHPVMEVSKPVALCRPILRSFEHLLEALHPIRRHAKAIVRNAQDNVFGALQRR